MHLIRRKNPFSEYRVKTTRMPRKMKKLNRLVSTNNSFGSRSGLTFLVNNLDQDLAQQSHPVNLFGIVEKYIMQMGKSVLNTWKWEKGHFWIGNDSHIRRENG